ncbi:hypothetical protein PFISCL1PPCAC_12664, partial [Pristionchus fissidentatus]
STPTISVLPSTPASIPLPSTLPLPILASQPTRAANESQNGMTETMVLDLVESVERGRAIVIYGIPEFPHLLAAQRDHSDWSAVAAIMNHLGVSGKPTHVFRMGSGITAGVRNGRLLKVIMPSRSIQRLVMERRHQLSQFKGGPGVRVWLRASMTREERAASNERPFTYEIPPPRPNLTNQNHLKILLDSQKYSILAFSESWLKQNVPDGLVLGENARSYQILRCDRKKKKGGETVNDAYEILIFDAMISSILIRFCIVYRVPALSQELSEGIWGKIIDYSICQHPIIVMGDFNIPNLKWPLDDEKEYNGLEGDFKDFLEMANMTQLVDKPTRDNNFLDLLLTNGDELIRNVEILPEIGNSDHGTIEFQLSISHKPPKCINRRNFSKGNYQTINSILAKINWSLVFKCDDSTNIMYEKLLSILEVIIEFRVPMTRVNMSGMPIPPFIEKQMKFRFLYWQKWITSNDPLYKGEFQRAHKICMKSMKKYVKNREKTILSSADKKGFYRYIKSKLSDTKGSKIDSLVNAYCIYVRPTLEFSSSAARPINSTDRGKIEKVQNAVTRRILYRTMNYTYSNRPNYSTRNEMLNISSLEYRRNVNDIKIAYQMIFGNGRLSEVMPDFFSLVRTRTRGAGYKVDIDMAKLKQRENSFAHRISKLLISLLQKVKLPTNYSEFTKRMIDE